MHLTQFAIINAVATDKPIKLSDGEGLHLLVQPNGRKLWRFRYRFAGRENMLAFGSFPTVSLGQARTKREEARKLLADGTDPAAKRKLDRIASEVAARTRFGDVAAEYIENLVANGAAESTVDKNRWLLQDLAAPLAKRPVTEILPAEILLILKRIEKSGRRDTARRLRGVLGSVFRYAIVTLRATVDPTLALRGALLKPLVKHRAAITEERELGALMVAIDEYDGWPTLRAAMLFLALTMTRPGDVRHMRCTEVNFEKAIWRIPAERMKMRRPHDVPLSTQALKILREVWSLSEYGELVFPSIRSIRRPLSENAMNSALRRMGYGQDEMTAHGFRAAASTVLNERGFSPDVIEAALAHQEENDVRRAYNRATYWSERLKLMQQWADLLDEFRRFSVRGHRVA
jgi:integrase